MAQQVASPTSDIVSAGWTPTPGAPATLFDKLETNDPSEKATSALAPDGSQPLEVKFAPLIDPDTGNLTVKYGLKKNAAGGARIDFVVRLLEGAAERGSWPHANVPSTGQVFTQTVPEGDFTAFTDLRLEFTPTQV